MSIQQKITDEGLLDYLGRRIPLIMGTFIMLITVGNLLVKMQNDTDMATINILLCVVAVANFVLVTITYKRYKHKSGNYSVKYTRLALRLTKIILGVAGSALTLPLLLSNAEHSMWTAVVNISLISLYLLYIVVQLLLLLAQLFLTRTSQKIKHARQQRKQKPSILTLLRQQKAEEKSLDTQQNTPSQQ